MKSVPHPRHNIIIKPLQPKFTFLYNSHFSIPLLNTVFKCKKGVMRTPVLMLSYILLFYILHDTALYDDYYISESMNVNFIRNYSHDVTSESYVLLYMTKNMVITG